MANAAKNRTGKSACPTGCEDILAETRPDANLPIERRFRLISFHGRGASGMEANPGQIWPSKRVSARDLIVESRLARELIRASIVY
jgi:hypothetical protein